MAINASTKSFKVVGLILGIGFGLLRVAKADSLEDYLLAAGLTIIEGATVMGLDWFAAKHREVASTSRSSQAQIVALESAITTVDEQIEGQSNTCLRLQQAIRQREMEVFDVVRVAEAVAWAAEAAYRESINANQRLLEGGSLSALPSENRTF
jgi:hypothetical protein